MGAIADALVAYAQPLIDATDGSIEQVQKALDLATMCFTLAQLPEAERDEFLDDMRIRMDLAEEEFAVYRRTLIDPMIEPHDEMFAMAPLGPRLERRSIPAGSNLPFDSIVYVGDFDDGEFDDSDYDPPARRVRTAPKPAIAPLSSTQREDRRNSACPCGSGRKYKNCCGPG